MKNCTGHCVGSSMEPVLTQAGLSYLAGLFDGVCDCGLGDYASKSNTKNRLFIPSWRYSRYQYTYRT